MEKVRLPNGEPPGGGSKIPSTASSTSSPEGVRNVTGEPTESPCSSAYSSSTTAPSRPSSAKTCCEPSIQSSVIASDAPSSTAVMNSFESKRRASAVRTLATASTRSASSTASAALVGIGEKLFCAVIA